MKHLLAAALLCLPALARADDCAPKNAAPLRVRLNPGYAMLYQEAEGLPGIHWLVDLKQQSSESKHLVDDAIAYWKQLTRTMEKLAAAHPDLDLKMNPMSDVLGEAREAQGEDRFHAMRPVVGESGPDFERDLTMLLRDAIDEQRHIAAVLQKDETNPELKSFLADTYSRLNRLHGRFDRQLQRYFKNP